MEKTFYIFENLFWFALSFLLYNNVMFMTIKGTTKLQSLILLAALAAVNLALGFISILKKRDYNGIDTFYNLVLPYAVYTMIAYGSYGRYKIFFAVVLCLAGLLYIYTVYHIMSRPFPAAANIKKVKHRRRIKCIECSRRVFAVVLCLAMVPMGVKAVCRIAEYAAKVKPVSGTSEEADPWTIDNNAETIGKLSDEIWYNLSTDEKLDVLQVIANIEARNLGIPHELNVEGGQLTYLNLKTITDSKKITYGQYDDTNHTITINTFALDDKDGAKMLNTVCHEARHAYQFRLVDLYNSLDDKSLTELYGFNNAAKYEEEFNSHPDSFEEYYNSACEKDARAYADRAQWEYLYEIESDIVLDNIM